MPAGAVFFCLHLDVEGEEADDCDLLLWEGGVVELKKSKNTARMPWLLKVREVDLILFLSSFVYLRIRT